MKNIFKSDANFKQNVTVNKTLTASQLEDSSEIAYIKQEKELFFSNERDEIEVRNVDHFGTVPFKLAQKIKGNIEENYIITEKDIKDIRLRFSQDSDIYIGQDYKVEFDQYTKQYQISWFIKYDGELPNYHEEDLSAEITIEYAYDKQHSYRDYNILYGKDGILRNIQNRLDNLKSNFESIGFEYKAGDEFSSNIETLMVDSATVNDVILPKNIYDGELTKLTDILENITERIKNTWKAHAAADLTATISIDYGDADSIHTQSDHVYSCPIGQAVQLQHYVLFRFFSWNELKETIKTHSTITGMTEVYQVNDMTNIQVNGIKGPPTQRQMVWHCANNPSYNAVTKLFLFKKEGEYLSIETEGVYQFMNIHPEADVTDILFYYEI